MRTMMKYPWTTFMSAHDPLQDIEFTRKNYNLNGLGMASSVNFKPDVQKAADATKAMLTTEFTGDAFGLEENKKDIWSLSSRMQDNLKFLGLSRFRQVGD